jgi:hypothetical protein
MVEANHSIQQKALIQVTTAAHVLAQLRARNAVKDQIRKQGLKPTHYSARISGWAIVYLDEHPELIPEAIANARAMILKGALGKRAARALAQSRECSQSYKITNTSQT